MVVSISFADCACRQTRWRYAVDLFCGRYGALQIRVVPELAGSEGRQRMILPWLGKGSLELGLRADGSSRFMGLWRGVI